MTAVTLLHTLNGHLFPRLLTASWQAAAMAVLVWLVTLLAGRSISARWRCALWSLVFIRLVLPALPPSPLSLLNLQPARTTVTTIANVTDNTVVTFGVIPDGQRPTAAAETASAPIVSVTPAPRLNWPALAWLTVAIALMLRGGLAYGLLIRKLRRLSPINDARLALATGKSGITAVETDLVTAPGLIGIIRPRLLLPPGLLDRVSPAELRFIVLHELAHARRRDLLIAAITGIITALHWFNPFVWLAAARFRAEREMACDEAVLRASSRADERADYGRAILHLLELISPATNMSPRNPPGVAGVLSASRRTLRRRIARIAAAPPVRRFAPLGPVLVLLIAIATLTGPRTPLATAATDPVPITPATVPITATTTTTATTSPNPLDTVTRVYDIRDLLVDFTNFEPNFDEDGWPSPTPATTQAAKPQEMTEKARARDERIRKLMADITGSIDPMSWRNNTGTTGSIRELNGQLIITQTQGNQERIQQKLAAMRGPRSIQVTLEMHFLTGVDAEAVLKHRWPPRPATQEGYDLWPRFLDDHEVDLMFRESQHDRKATLITAPRITLFNGQRSYVLVSRQSPYVADLVRKTGDADSYDPVVKVAKSGVMIDVRAQVVSDDDGGAKYVALMLNPRLSTLLEFTPQRWPGSPAGRDNLSVQVPHTLVTHLETTVTVPNRQTVLYRIYPVHKPATRPSNANLQPTLLLVKPTVIEAREQPQKQFPLISTRLSDDDAARSSATSQPALRRRDLPPLDSSK